MIHLDWLLKRVRVSRDGRRRIPDLPDPLVKRRDEKANVVFICLFFFVWFRQGEGNRALWVVLKLVSSWNWEKVPLLNIVVNGWWGKELEIKVFLSFKTVFLYLSSWILHGSGKIASLILGMSLLEKAPTSIFDEDQRPITETQGRAATAGLSSFCLGMPVVQWHEIISVL